MSPDIFSSIYNLISPRHVVGFTPEYYLNYGKLILAEYTKLYCALTFQVNSWQDVPLNIAICGQSGAGKSTIINTLRGLIPANKGACKVGVTETTKKVSKHPHPRYNNFILWDLPGAGTPTFPRETYLQVTEFDKYDFFLIITKERFMEDDLWLAKEVERARKVFFLVRTRLDENLKNHKADYPTTYSEAAVIKEIRMDCEKNLRRANLSCHVYVISGKINHTTRWDYPRLLDDMISKTSGLQRHAMVLSLTANSRKMIEQKYEMMKQDVKIQSAALCVTMLMFGNLVTFGNAFFQRYEEKFEVEMFLKYVKEFKERLNLSHEMLSDISQQYGIPLPKLLAAIKPIMETTDRSIQAISSSVTPRHTLEKIIHSIPIVGNWTLAGASTHRMKKYLSKILKDIKEAALKVQDLVEEVSKREI